MASSLENLIILRWFILVLYSMLVKQKDYTPMKAREWLRSQDHVSLDGNNAVVFTPTRWLWKNDSHTHALFDFLRNLGAYNALQLDFWGLFQAQKKPCVLYVAALYRRGVTVVRVYKQCYCVSNCVMANSSGAPEWLYVCVYLAYIPFNFLYDIGCILVVYNFELLLVAKISLCWTSFLQYLL